MSSEEVVPWTADVATRLGEVDLNDAVACAVLLDDIRQLEAQLSSAKVRLSAAILDRARVDGVTSYDLPGRLRAEVRSGSRKTIAGDVLEQALRKAGMPEERITEIVSTEVSYKVNAREAKKAAGVNEAYAKALAKATSEHEAQPSVTVRRR